MRAWIYILIAAIFQVAWSIVLKFLDFKKLYYNFVESRFDVSFFVEFIYLILYFAFGLIIVFFISRAYKLLPMSIAYAYWMGLAMIIQSIVDVLFFQEKFKFEQYFFLLIMLIGIIGIKKSIKSKSVEEDLAEIIEKEIIN